MGIDLRLGGGADGVAASRDRVPDMAVDQGVDGGVIEGVADEGVGNAVLQGAQVDVGERRLGHGRDDSCDPRQIVGQRLIDHDVARIGTFLA